MSWLLLLVLTMPTNTPAVDASPRVDLPAIDLPHIDQVRGARAAHIAHISGDHDSEFETLSQMRESFPRDLAVVYSFLRFHNDHSSSADQMQEIQRVLIAELEHPEAQPPAALLSKIAHDADFGQDLHGKVAAHIERRQASSPDFLEVLVSIYQRFGERDAHIEALERLTAVRPTAIRRWQLIRQYEHADRWQEAADSAAAWLEQGGPELALLSARADYFSRLGRFDELVEIIERMLELEKVRLAPGGELAYPLVRGKAMPYMTFGIISEAAWNLRDAGRDEDAEKLFSRLAELNPDSKGAREALLYLYGSREEQLAHRAARESELIEAADPMDLYQEGTDRLTAGDAAAAIDLLERAAPELPELEAVWYNLGMAAYQVERWQTVVDAFEHAGTLNPTRVQTWLYGGLALEKLGRCAEAVVSLEKALGLDPSKTLAHYFLSTCYRQLGDVEKSRHHRRLYDEGQ